MEGGERKKPGKMGKSGGQIKKNREKPAPT